MTDRQQRGPTPPWKKGSTQLTPTRRATIFVALLAVIGSTAATVTQAGWTVWSVAAMSCAVAIVVALLLQMTSPKR